MIKTNQKTAPVTVTYGFEGNAYKINGTAYDPDNEAGSFVIIPPSLERRENEWWLKQHEYSFLNHDGNYVVPIPNSYFFKNELMENGDILIEPRETGGSKKRRRTRKRNRRSKRSKRSKRSRRSKR